MTDLAEPIPASEVEPEAPDVGTELSGVEELDEYARLERLRKFGVSKDAADVKMIPTELLALAKRNPRRGAVAAVIESLREFGQHRPCVVQQSTGEVIVGNHLLRATRQLGWPETACLIVGDDDDQALRRGLADNFVGDQAEWDEEELAAVLRDTGAVPGIDELAVQKLLAKLEEDVEEPDDPTYPLMPQLNEKYEIVLVVATNETDWAWLETTLDLRSERSYKSTAIQKAHVVTVERLQELFGEQAGG